MADTIKTNLGPVTAYADAKAHGYTGMYILHLFSVKSAYL